MCRGKVLSDSVIVYFENLTEKIKLPAEVHKTLRTKTAASTRSLKIAVSYTLINVFEKSNNYPKPHE